MSGASDWWGFMRRHGAAIGTFVVAVILAAAWGVWVFWWYTGYAQSTALVPSALSFWTVGNLLWFIVYAVLWEILLVGIPATIGAIVAWRWWKRLPLEDRMMFHWGGKSRSTGGSGAVSFLLFVGFCIKVYLDGNWNVPIASFTLGYVVGSVITILVWAAAIFGIPVAIALTLWAYFHTKKH